eukprot:gene33531-40566_t
MSPLFFPAFLLIAVLLSLCTQVLANCPNFCSGRGSCNSEGKCICEPGFVAADCSQQKCPSGPAWSGKPHGLNMAHRSSECSNQGLCDRDTGRCQCFDGFEGTSCERAKCDCNGHGTCATINTLRETLYPALYTTPYALWDRNQTTACICDVGYTGPGCEERMCPKGDDPLTPFSSYRSIVVTVEHVAASPSGGSHRFSFMGQSLALPVTIWSEQECQRAFSTVPNIDAVQCGVKRLGRFNGYSLLLQFLSFPVIPHENNLYTHGGNPPLFAFSCDSSSVQTVGRASCRVADVVGTDYPEYVYCSNRGRCDFSSGRCRCFTGFYGANCASFNYALREANSSADEDILRLVNGRSTFAGSVLKLSSQQTGSSAFDFVRVTDLARSSEAGSQQVFRLDGFGNVFMHYGGLVIRRGGQTIEQGGLAVAGGATVSSGGVRVLAGGLTVTAGGLTVTSGGMQATGGLTVSSGGLQVGAGGMTVSAGGLRVQRNGLVVHDNGLTITAGGLYVGGSGVSIQTGGLQVTNGLTIWSSGLVIQNSGISINAGGMQINGGLTISQFGMQVTGGLTVSSGGLGVLADGLSVTGGLVATGGLSVLSGGLQVSGGLSLVSGGVAVSGGLTLSGGGVAVTGG